jgi:hypothetical protein
VEPFFSRSFSGLGRHFGNLRSPLQCQWRRALPRGGREAVDPHAGRNQSGMVRTSRDHAPDLHRDQGRRADQRLGRRNLRSTTTICPAWWPTRTRALTVRAPSRSAPLPGPSAITSSLVPALRARGSSPNGPVLPGTATRTASAPGRAATADGHRSRAGLSQGRPPPGHPSPPRPREEATIASSSTLKDRRIGHPPRAHDPRSSNIRPPSSTTAALARRLVT